jgi:phosphoribosyl-ATP pyrophosphohydrolase
VPAARRPVSSRPLDKLERTIAARAEKPHEKSYTTKLLTGGLAKIGPKITEEAAEVVEAAGEPGDAGREHFIREVADLTYHLLVMMNSCGCTIADLEAELSRRFGVSGLEEKAARPAKKAPVAKAAVAKAAVAKTPVEKTTVVKAVRPKAKTAAVKEVAVKKARKKSRRL